MIPIIVFVALSLMLIPLFLYAFIDSRNKLYANIVSGFLCALLAAYLAVVISIGIVQYDPVTTASGAWAENNTCVQYEERNQTQECIEWSNTTLWGTTCSDCPGIPVRDASVGYMYTLISVIMMIYSLYMVYEAYDERKMDKEAS